MARQIFASDNATIELDGKLYDSRYMPWIDLGMRLTSCCACFSTYDLDDGTLCCKRCHQAVNRGEGDGSENITDHYVVKWDIHTTPHHGKTVTACVVSELNG
jgi:hypothetical protein